MKFFTATAFLTLFATSVTAQQAFIGSPADGFQVSPGQSFTVRVDRPNFQSSAKEVVITLGFKNCGSNGCLSPDNGIGTELYSGSFNPQYDNPAGSTPPHQNYNVTIPEWVSKGPAMLSLVHYSLIGAGLMPWMESKSISVTVV